MLKESSMPAYTLRSDGRPSRCGPTGRRASPAASQPPVQWRSSRHAWEGTLRDAVRGTGQRRAVGVLLSVDDSSDASPWSTPIQYRRSFSVFDEPSFDESRTRGRCRSVSACHHELVLTSRMARTSYPASWTSWTSLSETRRSFPPYLLEVRQRTRESGAGGDGSDDSSAAIPPRCAPPDRY